MTILFWLEMLIALLTGQAMISQESSITSNSSPQITTEIKWPCGEETCWARFSELGVESGT